MRPSHPLRVSAIRRASVMTSQQCCAAGHLPLCNQMLRSLCQRGPGVTRSRSSSTWPRHCAHRACNPAQCQCESRSLATPQQTRTRREEAAESRPPRRLYPRLCTVVLQGYDVQWFPVARSVLRRLPECLQLLGCVTASAAKPAQY